MGKKQEILDNIIDNAVAALGYEYLGCDRIPQPGAMLLRVYIDSPRGVTISDCEHASRQISAMLDVEEPLLGHYILEVSSPGIDRRLFKLEQCARFIGNKVKVRMRVPVEGQRNFSGILHTVTDKEIILLIDDKQINLAFDNVEKANLIPEVEFKKLIKKDQ